MRNGITRIRGRSKELAFDLLAACHGGDLALISQDDEVALCHGADSLSQFQWLYQSKERASSEDEATVVTRPFHSLTIRMGIPYPTLTGVRKWRDGCIVKNRENRPE